MSFDFTNYTFSFFITILSTILGLGYPIIIQNIRTIDDLYQSTRLTARFQQEPSLFWYKISLLLSIGVSFIAPFVMSLWNTPMVCVCVEIIQAVIVLSLVMSVLWLMYDIQEYNNPDALAKRLSVHGPMDGGVVSKGGGPKSGDGGKDALFDGDNGDNGDICSSLQSERQEVDIYCNLDLARYASEKKNYQLFRQCMSSIHHFAFQEMMNKSGNVYNISPLLVSVIEQMTDYSCHSKNYYFNNNNYMVNLVLNYLVTDKYYLGQDCFYSMWKSLNRIIESNSKELFYGYWDYAVQFYTYSIKPEEYKINLLKLNISNNEKISEDFEKYKNEYKEFHWMVGTLLVDYYLNNPNKKAEMLSHALFYTSSQPPTYNLVPSSLNEISELVEKINSYRSIPWSLQSKYPMYNITASVISDERLLNYVYMYIALLVIRIDSVGDYNITYSNPYEKPLYDKEATNYYLQTQIELYEKIVYHINKWYEKDSINILKSINLPDFRNNVNEIGAKKEIEELIEDIKKTINIHTNRISTEPSKIEKLKELLVEQNRAQRGTFLNFTPKNKVLKESNVKISISETIDPRLYSKYESYDWSNFPDVVIDILNRKILNYYLGNFNIFAKVIHRDIPKNKIFEKIEQIGTNDAYEIWDMGANISLLDCLYNRKTEIEYYTDNRQTYKGMDIRSIACNWHSILIIPKEQVPAIEFCTDKETIDYKTETFKKLENSDLYINDLSSKDQNDKPINLRILKDVLYRYNPDMRFFHLHLTDVNEKCDDFDDKIEDIM